MMFLRRPDLKEAFSPPAGHARLAPHRAPLASGKRRASSRDSRWTPRAPPLLFWGPQSLVAGRGHSFEGGSLGASKLEEKRQSTHGGEGMEVWGLRARPQSSLSELEAARRKRRTWRTKSPSVDCQRSGGMMKFAEKKSTFLCEARGRDGSEYRLRRRVSDCNDAGQAARGTRKRAYIVLAANGRAATWAPEAEVGRCCKKPAPPAGVELKSAPGPRAATWARAAERINMPS